MFAVPALPQKNPSSSSSAASSSSTPQPTPPPLNYEEPDWSAPARPSLAFEVIKNGAAICTLTIPTTAHNYCTIGRLPICDFPMEHPSVSRYHAVVQFKSDGTAYIYDLGSAHHTRLNKKIVPPRQHVRIRTGDQLRFGESTRTFCLLGDKELDEEEVERELEERRRMAKTTAMEMESVGISWGFTEDATEQEEPEEGDVTTLPAGMRPSFLREADAHLGRESSDGPSFKGDEDAFYRKDPKKALRNYLEHRGLPVQYETEEDGPGHARIYTSRIHLGFEDESGPVYGNATAGRRRESEQLAALNAMEKLDGMGMLKTKAQVADPQIDARKKRLKALLRENDEDENFYDKTGSADRNRRKKIGNLVTVVETYDSLLEKKRTLEIKEADLRSRVAVAEEQKKVAAARKTSGPMDEDDIENYLATLKQAEKIENVAELQRQIKECKKEDERLDKLIRVAKPSTSGGLPTLIRPAGTEMVQNSASKAINGTQTADHGSSPPDQATVSSNPLSDHITEGDAATPTVEMQQDATSSDIKMPPPVIPSIRKSANAPADTSPSLPLPREAVNPALPGVSAGSVKRRRAPMGPSFPSLSNDLPSQTDGEEQGKEKTIEKEGDQGGFEDEAIDPAKRLKMEIAEQMTRGGLIRQEKKGKDLDDGNDIGNGAERKRRRVAPAAALLDERTANDRDSKVDEKEAEVEEWVPPVGQSGDGFTSLNAKYGY